LFDDGIEAHATSVFSRAAVRATSKCRRVSTPRRARRRAAT
jgi:hypothetical protein